jgi:hypothetical protein
MPTLLLYIACGRTALFRVAELTAAHRLAKQSTQQERRELLRRKYIDREFTAALPSNAAAQAS